MNEGQPRSQGSRPGGAQNLTGGAMLEMSEKYMGGEAGGQGGGSPPEAEAFSSFESASSMIFCEVKIRMFGIKNCWADNNIIQ